MDVHSSGSDTDKMVPQIERHHEIRRRCCQWYWHTVNYFLPMLSLTRSVEAASVADRFSNPTCFQFPLVSPLYPKARKLGHERHECGCWNSACICSERIFAHVFPPFYETASANIAARQFVRASDQYISSTP